MPRPYTQEDYEALARAVLAGMPEEQAEKTLEEQRENGGKGEQAYWLTLKEEAKTAKTTIQIHNSTKLLLNELKLVQKESYDDVIQRLIKRCDDLEQQVETLIEDLEEAKNR
jgi:predicted CopG family antitoxin